VEPCPAASVSHHLPAGTSAAGTAALLAVLLALRPCTSGFRSRIAGTLAATFAGGVAWRLWLAFAAQALHLPLDDLTQPTEMASYSALVTAGYFPSGTRVAELAVGAMMGLLLCSPSALNWIYQRWVK